MTPEELKALLEKAVAQGNVVKAENEKLQTKANNLETTVSEMKSNFEAMAQKLKDGGGEGAGDLKKALDTILELQNEISDVRSKMKAPMGNVSVDQKKAIESVVMKAVGSFVKTKNNQLDFITHVTDTATEQFKALNISSPETGGLAIAATLSRDVMDYARDMSPILGEVGRNSGMTRSYSQLITVSYPNFAEGIENVAGVVPAETDTQTFAEVKSKEFKLYAQPRLTNEVLYGTDINVYGQLVELLGEAEGIYLASQILYGNAADKNARGILASARFNVTNLTGESWKPTLGTGRRDADFFPAYATGVSGDIGTDDKSKVDFLLTFMRKLPKRYRKNAKLYMNENTLLAFELLRDAQDKPVFRTDYMDGEPRLNGKTIVIDDTLPDIAVDSAFIIYGDLPKAYAINDGDINQMLLDPYTKKGSLIIYTEKEMFEMVQRSDAILIAVATTNAKA